MAQAESAVHQAYLVIDEPKFPSQPASSRMDAAMNSVIFVVVGVVLSVVGVLGAALLDRSHRFAVDVRYTLELPVLALVPDGAAADKPKKGKKRIRTRMKRRAEFRVLQKDARDKGEKGGGFAERGKHGWGNTDEERAEFPVLQKDKHG
ncbi:MAG: hypothetical protein IPL78_30885 [Chloroflexi bacterium]|nr:hypothetical protein [Chloroflexota bacterium]